MEYSEKQSGSKLPPVISGGAGAAAGVAATSGVAMSAAGGGAAGVSGYVAGTGVILGHIGCEAAAIAGLGTLLAGPLLGGLLGYGIYRGVKKVVQG